MFYNFSITLAILRIVIGVEQNINISQKSF